MQLINHKWLLPVMLLSLAGCSNSVQSIDDALANYTAQCMDAGTSNASMNTKLSGQSFNMDIALVDKNTGLLASLTSDVLSQINSITSDLTETTSQAACEAGSAGLTDLNVGGTLKSVLNLTKSLGSKQTLNNLSMSQAHKQVFCRANILSAAGNLYRKCAAASFAVRPANFVMEVVTPANGSQIVAAGEGGATADAKAIFTLKVKAVGAANAVTSLTGFTGTTLNLNLTAGNGLAKLLPLNKVGTNNLAAALDVKGILSPASFVFSNGEATAKMTYSEVGYINIDQGALLDTAFTLLDANAGRCVAGDTSNTPNAQGKVGCAIGSTLAKLPIKFVPYQLKVDAPVTKTFADSNNSCSKFAYFGGEVTTDFGLKAVNSVGNVTKNYNTASGLAIFDGTDYSNYNVPALTVKNSLNQDATITFQKSTAANAISAGSWVNGVSQVSIKHLVARPAVPLVPQLLTIKTTPSDGEVDTTSLTPDAMSGAVEYRYGRLRLANAYGSETMAVNLDVNAQYFDKGTWVNNKDDSCSTLTPLMFNFTVGDAVAKNKLRACGSQMSGLNNGVFNGGVAKMQLSAPGNGNNGWFKVKLLNSGNPVSCVRGQGRVVSALNKALPQFLADAETSNEALVSFGQYKSKMIYSGEQ